MWNDDEWCGYVSKQTKQRDYVLTSQIILMSGHPPASFVFKLPGYHYRWVKWCTLPGDIGTSWRSELVKTHRGLADLADHHGTPDSMGMSHDQTNKGKQSDHQQHPATWRLSSLRMNVSNLSSSRDSIYSSNQMMLIACQRHRCEFAEQQDPSKIPVDR